MTADWISTTEAARIAGASYDAIMKRITRGQVVVKRNGRQWLVLRSSVAPKDKFAKTERPAEGRTSTGR